MTVDFLGDQPFFFNSEIINVKVAIPKNRYLYQLHLSKADRIYMTNSSVNGIVYGWAATQTSPSSKNSFFQIGTVSFNVSIAY